MEEVIRDLIEYADFYKNREIADIVYNILCEITCTYNCPSDWQNLCEYFLNEYKDNKWITDNCKLYEFCNFES